MKRTICLILLAVSLICPATAATRRALTVFIGDYPESTGWNKLASANDRTIILKMLKDNAFLPENIICLQDREATHDAIVNALDRLLSLAETGDQIYVHFSCHGQQITDQNGDEALINPRDIYDEAIVPADACIAYGWNGYKGENHIIDDVLNRYFNAMTSKIGKRGCLLVINDACHSGGLERRDADSDTLHFRGTFDAFEQPFEGSPAKLEIQPVTWVSVSACKDFQTNFEVNIDGKRYGRLSYAMARSFHAGMTAVQLTEALTGTYRSMPLPAGKAQTLASFVPEKLKNKKLFGQ